MGELLFHTYLRTPSCILETYIFFLSYTKIPSCVLKTYLFIHTYVHPLAFQRPIYIFPFVYKDTLLFDKDIYLFMHTYVHLVWPNGTITLLFIPLYFHVQLQNVGFRHNCNRFICCCLQVCCNLQYRDVPFTAYRVTDVTFFFMKPDEGKSRYK